MAAVIMVSDLDGPAMVLALMALEVIRVAAVSVRGLDDEVKERLRVRAAENGRSMESEIRAILIAVVSDPERSGDLFTAFLDRFSDLGGVELDLPRRANPVRAANLVS